MRIQHLHLLLAIAEYGSLRSAAQVLQVSQPVLTRSLGQLEAEIGVALVIRTPRGVGLSPEGEILATRASKALDELAQASEELEWQAKRHRSRIAVGLSPEVDPLVVPRAFASFRQRVPGVRLRIIDAPFARSEALLRAGEIDLAIGPLPPGSFSAALVAQPLFESVNVVVASSSHPLAEASRLVDLAAAPWVRVGPRAGAGDPTRLGWAALGAKPPDVRLDCESLSTLLAVLGSDELLAVVPYGFMARYGAAMSLVRVPIVETLPVTRVRSIRKVRSPFGGLAGLLVGSFVAQAHAIALATGAPRAADPRPPALPDRRN